MSKLEKMRFRHEVVATTAGTGIEDRYVSMLSMNEGVFDFDSHEWPFAPSSDVWWKERERKLAT